MARLSPIKRSMEKFRTNAERMERNFNRGNQRCGYYDEDNLPHGGPERKRREADDDVFRYDREDPAKGTKQITTGFRKWAERYLAACSGQKTYKHQVNRMNKWNDKLQEHLVGEYWVEVPGVRPFWCYTSDNSVPAEYKCFNRN